MPKNDSNIAGKKTSSLSGSLNRRTMARFLKSLLITPRQFRYIFIVRWRVWMVTKMLIIVTKISLSEKNFFFILDEPSSRVTRIEIKVCTLLISVTDLTFHTTHKHTKIVGKFVAIMSSRGPFLKVPVNSGPKKLSVLRFFLSKIPDLHEFEFPTIKILGK